MGDMPAEGKPAPGEVARAAHVEHAGIAVRSAQDQLLFLVLPITTAKACPHHRLLSEDLPFPSF